MLTTTGYSIAFAAGSVAAATAALLGVRRGATLHFLLAWLAPAAVFVALGYVDWHAQPAKETSLRSYVVGGLLAPLVAVAVARALRGRTPELIQWLAAGAACFLTII